jgi:hypothetical protein
VEPLSRKDALRNSLMDLQRATKAKGTVLAATLSLRLDDLMTQTKEQIHT